MKILNTRDELKALDTSVHRAAFLKEGDRAGVFVWHSGDNSAKIAADAQEGIYIKADNVDASNGAWVRENYKDKWNILWFGADNTIGNSVDHTPVLNAAMNTAEPGQVIFFPAGQYKFFSKPIDVPKPLTLEGASVNMTFLVREYDESASEKGLLNFVATGNASEDGSGGPHNSIVRNLSILAGHNTSGGNAIHLKSTDDGALSYMVLENLRLSTYQVDGWDHTLLIDGREHTSGTRDISLKNVMVFGSKYYPVRLFGVQGFTWYGGGWFGAGGSSDRLDLSSGGVAPKSTGPILSISGAGEMAIAETVGLVFTGRIGGDLHTNSSANNCVVLGQVGGSSWHNWQNSSHYGP